MRRKDNMVQVVRREAVALGLRIYTAAPWVDGQLAEGDGKSWQRDDIVQGANGSRWLNEALYCSWRAGRLWAGPAPSSYSDKQSASLSSTSRPSWNQLLYFHFMASKRLTGLGGLQASADLARLVASADEIIISRLGLWLSERINLPAGPAGHVGHGGALLHGSVENTPPAHTGRTAHSHHHPLAVPQSSSISTGSTTSLPSHFVLLTGAAPRIGVRMPYSAVCAYLRAASSVQPSVGPIVLEAPGEHLPPPLQLAKEQSSMPWSRHAAQLAKNAAPPVSKDDGVSLRTRLDWTTPPDVTASPAKQAAEAAQQSAAAAVRLPGDDWPLPLPCADSYFSLAGLATRSGNSVVSSSDCKEAIDLANARLRRYYGCTATGEVVPLSQLIRFKPARGASDAACRQCTDVRDAYMTTHGLHCANWTWAHANRCNTHEPWRALKTCQVGPYPERNAPHSIRTGALGMWCSLACLPARIRTCDRQAASWRETATPMIAAARPLRRMALNDAT